MRIYPEQFADHLKAGLRPCYLVFGAEPRLETAEQASDLAHPSTQPEQVLMRVS
jgi:DNA polymerase III delta subunit